MTGYVLRRLAPDVPAIARLYCEGASFNDLGERYKCAPSTIRRLLISEGVALKPVVYKHKLDAVENEVLNAFRAGENVQALAVRFNVSLGTVMRLIIDRETARIRNL